MKLQFIWEIRTQNFYSSVEQSSKIIKILILSTLGFILHFLRIQKNIKAVILR